MLKLFSKVEGAGPPVLLIPGMLATTRFWDEISEKLSKSHKVISIDPLGFGKSLAPKNIEYSIDDHVKSIESTLENEKIHDSLIVVGHSMGALLTVYFALENPNLVKKLILISPPIFKSKTEARENIKKFSSLHPILLYGWIAQITCYIFCKNLRPLTRLFVIKAFKDLPREIASDSLLHSFHSYSKTLENIIENQNIIPKIGKLKIPIKIIYGESDKRIIKQNISDLEKLNTNISVASYPNLAHQLPLEKPELVLKEIN